MCPAHVFDVDELNFQAEVLDHSKQRPVVVDFWAPWCGPCQALGPILEKLAAEYDGEFILAKLNTDENPNIAAAFQIQSIPAVFLLKDGKVADAFLGARPEPEIREFLAKHVKAPATDEEIALQTKLASGDSQAMREVLEKRLEEDPQDAKAHLDLARLAFEEGDEDGVRRHLDAIDEDSEETAAAARLRGALRFRADGSGDEAGWRAKLEADPEDLDAHYTLGCCLAVEGRYEEALAEWMEVVKRNRRHQDGAAHQAMLSTFDLLGPGSDVARDFRRQLTIYL
jgi:putative thioredoxin